MKTVGFTGSRKGMNDSQKNKVKQILENLLSDTKRENLRIIHGGAEGSDDDFHGITEELGIFNVEVYPSDSSKLLSKWKGLANVKLHPPKPPLERNNTIVKRADLMIATPDGPEKLRSGTWATIRFAKKIGVPLNIVFP